MQTRTAVSHSRLRAQLIMASPDATPTRADAASEQATPSPPVEPPPDRSFVQPTSDQVLDALQIVYHQTATSYDGAAVRYPTPFEPVQSAAS